MKYLKHNYTVWVKLVKDIPVTRTILFCKVSMRNIVFYIPRLPSAAFDNKQALTICDVAQPIEQIQSGPSNLHQNETSAQKNDRIFYSA